MFRPVTFLNPKMLRPPTSLPPSSLLTSLVFYAKLDEASGTRVDVVGGNDLTDNNTVTQAAGVKGTDYAAQFTKANNECLSHIDNATLRHDGNPFTWTAWVLMDSKATVMGVVSKWVTGIKEYFLHYDSSTDRFRAAITSNGSSVTAVLSNNFGAPSTGTWYFLVYKYSGSSLSLSVNNGVADSAAVTVSFAGGTAELNIGQNTDGASQPWDGRIARVGFWKRALTAAEITNLYGGGTPPDYPFVGVP